MNEFRKLIVVFMACIGTAYSTDHYSGKTFLMPRSDGVNKALEFATWHTHIYNKHHEEQCHLKSNLQIVPFYQASLHKKRMGEYFGIDNCSNCFTIGDANPADSATPADIDGALLIHSVEQVQEGENLVNIIDHAAGRICLRPERNVVGVRLDYFQDINSPIKGLFFKATLPVAYVEHKLGASFCDTNQISFGTKNFTIQDFFAGCVNVVTGDEEATNNNLQSPLRKLKFKRGKRSKCGIADIDIALGYKYAQCEKSHAFFSVGFTIPTGNRVKSEHLFEPIYGNGRHLGIFATIDAGTVLWECQHGWLRVDGGINFKYLFEGTESRVPGVRGLPFGQYYLAGNFNQGGAPLFPLANVLCQKLRVKPGHQLDALVDFSFQNKCVVIDLGYNLYWKDKESLWPKEPRCINVIGIADPNYMTTTETFDLQGDTPKVLNDAFLTHDDIDFDAAKTPDQITHKIFAAVGYKYMINRHYPATASFGGSYEFSQTNAAFEQWGVWGKLGFSF